MHVKRTTEEKRGKGRIAIILWKKMMIQEFTKTLSMAPMGGGVGDTQNRETNGCRLYYAGVGAQGEISTGYSGCHL